MRASSLIVLLAIALSILSPSPVPLASAHGQTVIGTLDVCHAGSLAISISHDTPCVIQPLYHPHLPSRMECPTIVDPTIRPFVLAFPEEHPPKI